jgi:hypothetical protein
VSWKFVEGKYDEIGSRQGNKHSKADALRALLTPYRHDSRPSFDQQIYNSHHWSAFGLTGLGEVEVICLRNKAWRRDMAGSAPPGHGKEDSASPHNAVLRAKQPGSSVKSSRKRSSCILTCARLHATMQEDHPALPAHPPPSAL